MWIARSVQGIDIRLTEAAMEHIVEQRPEFKNQERLILQAISSPELVVLGDAGEFSAIRQSRSGKRLAVVYAIRGEDGFVITAFFLRNPGYYLRRKQIWP